jgi:hypothetical protein
MTIDQADLKVSGSTKLQEGWDQWNRAFGSLVALLMASSALVVFRGL